MKKLLSITIAIITLLTSFQTFTLSAFAAATGPDDFNYSVISEGNKTCEIISYAKLQYPNNTTIDDKNLNVVIPETINGYTVIDSSIRIDNAASITFPKTMRKFGYSKAGKIYLNSSIFDLAAAKAGPLNCDELYLNGKLVTELKYPGGTTDIRSIGYCRSITSITIPNSAKTIVDDAFGGYKNLKTVNLGNGVQKIGYWAFGGCSSLTSITLPNSLTEMGERVFQETALKSITIPGSLKKISHSDFEACKSLEEVIIKNGVQSIGDTAFIFCPKLTKVVIPKSVTTFGENLFSESPNVVIYGEKGSAAEAYANNNKIKFVDVNATTAKPVQKETTTKKKTTTTAPAETTTQAATETTTTKLTTLEATTLESTTEAETEVVQSKDKTSNTPLIVTISVIAVVALAGAGVAVWYFKFRKKNEE